jgi:hypothetical protein
LDQALTALQPGVIRWNVIGIMQQQQYATVLRYCLQDQEPAVEDASNHSPLQAAGKNSADGGHDTDSLSQPSYFVTAEEQGNEGEAEAPQQFDYIEIEEGPEEQVFVLSPIHLTLITSILRLRRSPSRLDQAPSSRVLFS